MLINRNICYQCFYKRIKSIISNRFLHTETTLRKVQELPAVVMKAWQLDSFGSIDSIKLATVSVPEIKNPSDVLVRVSASSINPLDLYMIDGFGENLLSKMRQFDSFTQGSCSSDIYNLPLTLGRDFSGKIVATGQNVTNLDVGGNVWGVVDAQNQGCHSEYVLTSRNNVCKVPRNVSNVEAASVPFVGLTCWSALVFTGGIRPDMANYKRVLILGASGGLGSLATQILSTWGAEVVGVCSEESFEFVRTLGAFELYDYRNESTLSDILSDTRGFDIILDAAGTADRKWMQALKKHSGASFISLRSPIPKNVQENGLFVGITKSIASIVQKNVCNMSDGRFYKWGNFSPNLSALEYLSDMMSSGKIRANVAKVFPFEEAPAAYRCYSEGGIKGKIVLDFLTDNNTS